MRDLIRNIRISEELQNESALEYIEEKQQSWWEHLKRMDKNIPVKNIYETKAEKNTGRGYRREDWNTTVTS